ncbi:MAG TPA: acetyl-CoA carboxylase, carboxyltransferase subunit beta [Planctomycetota bacterium]|nr:acetyl-CoA carboxylase, carboxyltransferase subunit beta [Planctomycetota bacterium]
MPRPDPKSLDAKLQDAANSAAKREPAPATPSPARGAKPRPEIADMPEPVAEPKAAATQGPPAADTKPAETSLSETRFARLRKKKDMPEGLWLKCERCGQMIYRKELEDKGRVCPACDFHFTLPGRERIAMVLDPGTWKEHFHDLRTIDRLKFHDQIPYLDKVKKAETRTGQAEALLCGTGAIEGRAIVLAVLDFSFLGGSMGEVVGEKIALAAELAAAKRLPLVIFTSSGGARMHEGVLSLMQMAKTCSALAELNDKGGFSICVMSHPTTGGVTASFASVCDLTLAEPGALIGFAGPRVIATTLKQELPAGFQRAEFLLSKGQIDAIVRRSEVRPLLARLLDYGRGPRVKAARTPRP